MARTEDLVISSDLDQLPRVLDFVREACRLAAMSNDDAFACELAADEACTNIMEHAYGSSGDGKIRIQCRCEEDRFFLIFRDRGEPFDPALVKEPNLGSDLMEREVGGLGLHFIRSLMDEISFEFNELEGNTLIMVKRLGPGT
ncbi:MAG: ATP-binding protein [Chloroflexota bacterium]|nr:ATP-binding protein [Chloroflexota bacterium]